MTDGAIDVDVDGLRELADPGHEQDYSMRFRSDNPLLQDTDGVSNLLLGGAGDDIIEGRFGDDFIDGDKVLRVALVHTPTGQRYTSAAALRAGVFSGAINPGDIDIVRSIVMDPASGDVDDTAVYRDEMSAYSITALPGGYWQITHSQAEDPAEGDGSDVIRGFERLQFSDGCAQLNEAGDAWESCEIGASVVLSTDAPAEAAADEAPAAETN